MAAVKTGVTFVLGAMCGALMSRGFQRCHRREALRRWGCDRKTLDTRNALPVAPQGAEAPPLQKVDGMDAINGAH